MKHVRALDGIRGIAVLLVMLFHFGYFAGGWIGVQVFFTLSGYLITSILLEDRGSPFPAFISRFYWRRALRIFPLFYGFLLVVATTNSLWGAPSSFPLDWPWLATFSANFARMRDTDLGPYFVHIWSLAVEEQFYLIWPLLVFFLSTRALRWTIATVLVLAPLIRFTLFQGMLGLGHDAEYAGKAAYVLPFTQFDAFAAGAAIPAWGLTKVQNTGRWLLVTLGVAAVAGATVLIVAHFWGEGAFIASLGYAMYLRQGYGYFWGYSLLNVISMLGIICALQEINCVRVLENRLLVWSGKISYGAYVYHLPLLLFGEYLLDRSGINAYGFARPIFFAAWLFTVFLVSSASFRWLEAPFLRLKDYQRARSEIEAR